MEYYGIMSVINTIKKEINMKHLYSTPLAELCIVSAIDVASISPITNLGAGYEDAGLHLDIEDFFGNNMW